MKINSFKCSNCKEYTRHIEITSREMSAIDGDGGVVGNVVVGILGDFLGFRHLTRNVTGYVPYKCCKCGMCAWRSSSGEDEGYIGFSK